MDDWEKELVAAGGELAEEEPEPTWWGSALRGALQGATLNYGDEIAGGISAAGKFINPLGDSFGDTEKFTENYEGETGRIRDENKRYEEANPGAYLVGDLLSPSPIGKIAAGGRLLGRAAKGAGEAIAATVGASEGDLSAGQVAGSGAVGVALPAAGRAMQGVANQAPAITRGFTNVFMGTNPDAARRYQGNVARVDAARPFDEQAVDLTQRAQGLRTGISEASTRGFEALPDTGGSIPVAQQVQQLRTFIDTNRGISGMEDSLNAAERILGDLEGNALNSNAIAGLRAQLGQQNLTGQQRNQILQQLLQEEGRLALQPRRAKSIMMHSMDPLTEGLGTRPNEYIDPAVRQVTEARTAISDELKRQYDPYRQVMATEAEPLTVLQRELRSRNLPSMNTDATASKLQTLGRPSGDSTRGPSRALLSELSRRIPGSRDVDLAEEAADRVALESFGRAAPGGSRRVKAFGDLLAAPGKLLMAGARAGTYAAGGFQAAGTLGAAGGVILGLASDVYGPRVGRNILANTNRISAGAQATLGRANRVFQTFEGQAGRATASAMHRMMIERDPEYRSAWEELGALAMEDPAAPSDVVDESAIMDTGSPLLVEQEGKQAKAANHFILMETDEDYRKQYLEDQGIDP